MEYILDTIPLILSLKFNLIATGVLFLILEIMLRVKPVRIVNVSKLHIKGAKALALPGYIFMTPDVQGCQSVIRHEMTHQDQMKRYTIFGVSCILGWHYGFGMVKSFFRNPKGFSMRNTFWGLRQTNPLEIEANENM
jgi:hypothetical protein